MVEEDRRHKEQMNMIKQQLQCEHNCKGCSKKCIKKQKPHKTHWCGSTKIRGCSQEYYFLWSTWNCNGETIVPCWEPNSRKNCGYSHPNYATSCPGRITNECPSIDYYD